jgi:dTMP kinase
LTRFEKEKLDFHKKVRRGFLYLANKDTKHWKIINANQPVDKVFQDIQKIVDYTLKHI